MFIKRAILFLITSLLLCLNVCSNAHAEALDHVNRNTMDRWGEYCVTIPNKKLGKCIAFNKCSYLHVVHDNLKFVKENLCGIVSNTPLVCCPLTNKDVPPHSSLSTTECLNDRFSKHISFGQNAKCSSSPWLALLSFDSAESVHKTFTCGGSLINYRYVITAAHCLKSPDNREVASVRLGEWDFSFTQYNDNCTRPVDVDVEEIIGHPNYRVDNKMFDIGLIRMKRAIFNDSSINIKPINLPFNYNYNGQQENDYSISGFGQTETKPFSDVKQTGNIQNVRYIECREKFAKRGGEIQQIQLCGTSNGTDTCFGDSGGSLAAMIDIDPNEPPCFALMGIVSYGTKQCGSGTLPSVYTNVLPFLEWISENIKS